MTAMTSRPPTTAATLPPIIDFWPSEEDCPSDAADPEAAAAEALDVVLLLIGLIVIFVTRDVDKLVIVGFCVNVDWLLCEVDVNVPCVVKLVVVGLCVVVDRL